MKKETAILFFSILFGGQHHINAEVKECGHGWQVNTYKDLSTFDGSLLTKLILMAHKYAVRVSICPSGPGLVKIKIWQRKREGSLCERHPTIEDAIKSFNLPENITENA